MTIDMFQTSPRDGNIDLQMSKMRLVTSATWPLQERYYKVPF